MKISLHNSLTYSLVTTTLLALSLSLVLEPAHAEELNLGDRKPTSQEIIDHLKATKTKRKSRSRGIRVLAQPPAAANPAAETQAAPEPDTAPAAISMQVLFHFNSAVLTREAIEYLHPLGQALQSSDLSGMRFLVEGHTDAIGPDGYNLMLSKRRAEAVKQYLLEYYGVQSAALDVIGRGEHSLLDPDSPDSPANRRVRIVSVN